ncbi:MAG TPA: IclR family transcriptional regulator C-terminal domain-containing protein [Kofleriaceae bacterium]|nr:IclR family transcriptional regulator C-terminal domain-containing protein [Kofleriaceae bacterium]
MSSSRQRHKAPEPSPDFVQSLARGLSVIEAMGASSGPMTLSQAAAATGLSRAAARRLLLTLTDLGYVSASGRNFSLTPRVLGLGYSYLASLPLAQVVLPPMERLVEEVHESSSVSVLDGDEIVYVARVPTKRIVTVNLVVGARLPAYVTSMGRVLLAALDPCELDAYFARVAPASHTSRTVTGQPELRRILAQVARQGWALVDQEFTDGVRSMAVPLHDRGGRVVAAMNVSSALTRRAQLQKDVLPRLLAAASEIDASLRHR